MTEKTMSENFVGRSNPELDKQIRECTDPELLRQLLKNQMERDGVLSRERDGSYIQTESYRPLTPAEPSRPVGTDGPFRRTITAGDKNYLISGPSEESLDKLEATLKAAQ
jgi:hypothetical protein